MLSPRGGSGCYGQESPVLLIGYTKNFQPIDYNRFYYIPAVRNGKSLAVNADMVNVSYLLLHTHFVKDGERIERRRFYKVKPGANFYTGEQLLDKGFHANDKEEDKKKFAANVYIGYELGESIPTDNDLLDFNKVNLGEDRVNVMPHFRTLLNPDIRGHTPRRRTRN